jgi:hypothetical protein
VLPELANVLSVGAKYRDDTGSGNASTALIVKEAFPRYSTSQLRRREK